LKENVNTSKLPEANEEIEDLIEEEEAPEEEPKSFIKKYWMYIVPILLVFVFSGGPDETKPGNTGNAANVGNSGNANQRPGNRAPRK
jgi:hypothetical protein